HGAEKRRVWHKLHLAVDPATHDIVAAEVSLENVHDAEVLPTLLNPLRRKLGRVYSTGGYDSDTVQDVMLRSVERCFRDLLPASPVEWLTDNGSAYRAHETRAFARELGLEPRTTAVRSPQSNGIAESFVKTMKRDYIEMMPKPDSRTAVGNLAIAFEHYNEQHPHSALGYRLPREFLRSRVSQP
ncbi:integrase core domain-containing protein, partial [Aeromonas hydrophila]|uniref:integrase core domain-containing protein n=1 Tax=Aeromonas hydrophila TaxID=644 RepID=UPI0021E7CDCF